MTVNPGGQRTIYSLPHLRTIMLRSSQFQYTPVPMPNHGVTHLRIFNIGSPAAFTHILRQVAGSLTTLEACSKDCGPVFSGLVRCPLLRSIALELAEPRPFPRTIFQFLELHPQSRIQSSTATRSQSFLHPCSLTSGGWRAPLLLRARC
jgi:hypothetical protein